MPDSTIILMVPGGIDIVVHVEGSTFRIDGVRTRMSPFATSETRGLSGELQTMRFSRLDEVIAAVRVELKSHRWRSSLRSKPPVRHRSTHVEPPP